MGTWAPCAPRWGQQSLSLPLATLWGVDVGKHFCVCSYGCGARAPPPVSPVVIARVEEGILLGPFPSLLGGLIEKRRERVAGRQSSWARFPSLGVLIHGVTLGEMGFKFTSACNSPWNWDEGSKEAIRENAVWAAAARSLCLPHPHFGCWCQCYTPGASYITGPLLRIWKIRIETNCAKMVRENFWLGAVFLKKFFESNSFV